MIDRINAARSACPIFIVLLLGASIARGEAGSAGKPSNVASMRDIASSHGITLISQSKGVDGAAAPMAAAEERFDDETSGGLSPEGSPQVVIMGSLTAGDLTQTGRLMTGSISNCAGPNTCPATLDSNARRYDAYTFVNNSAAQACITVQLNAAGCAGQFMASASYLNAHNPASLCTNFLGVHNSTFNGTQSYSYNVAGGATFVVVVYEATANTGCASYTLTVSSTEIAQCGIPIFTAMGSITASDPTQAGRLLTGVISNCTTAAACPGPVNTLARRHDTYKFVNKGAATACATVELVASGCGGNFMAAAAYLNSFDPNSLCTNYLGHHNSTFNGTQQFAVNIPAGETMVLSVYEANPDTGCPSYTLNVKACAGSGIVPVTPANGRIAFTSNRDGDTDIYLMDSDGTDVVNRTNNTTFSDDVAAWSPNARKIVFASNRDGDFEIYVMNADGSDPVNLTNNTITDSAPTWSPDGTRIAFQSNRDGNFEVYVMNADGSAPARLTNNAGADLEPDWFPDGAKIAFNSDRDGNTEIYMMNADGSVQTNVTNDASNDQLAALSPDGTKIAFQSNRTGNFEIFLMDRDGSDPVNLTNNLSSDGAPGFSPDGSKIVFHSLRDGNLEIYMMNADGSTPTRLTTDGGADSNPDWGAGALSCLLAINNGDIGQGSPDYPSTSGTQTGRLSQNGVHSTCAAPKATPSIISANRLYDAYRFKNESDGIACVTFTFPQSCAVNQAIRPVAYLNSFNPSNIAANYLGDFGSSINSSNAGTFAVNVPARSDVVLVVQDISTVGDCGNYSFSVSGLPCPLKITSIAKPAADRIALQALGVPSGVYSIEVSNDLIADPFELLRGNVIADGDGIIRFEDTGLTGLTKRFHRVTHP